MPAPRRKHLHWNRAEQSAHGRAFLRTVFGFLGGSAYVPIEFTHDRRHVFGVSGCRAAGIFAERQEEQDEERPGEYVSEGGLVLRSPTLPYAVAGEVTERSWDAWTEAHQTGDRSLIDGPRRRMYAVRDERNAKLAREEARASIHLLPEQAPFQVAGLTTADIALSRDESAATFAGQATGRGRSAAMLRLLAEFATDVAARAGAELWVYELPRQVRALMPVLPAQGVALCTMWSGPRTPFVQVWEPAIQALCPEWLVPIKVGAESGLDENHIAPTATLLAALLKAYESGSAEDLTSAGSVAG